MRNIAASYEMRLLYDLLSSDWKQNGLFFAAVTGKTVGNFDVLYDPRAREQVLVGQLAYRTIAATSIPGRVFARDPYAMDSGRTRTTCLHLRVL